MIILEPSGCGCKNVIRINPLSTGAGFLPSILFHGNDFHFPHGRPENNKGRSACCRHRPDLEVAKTGGFHSHGGSPKWFVCKGKSHLEMDDDWGYPYFRKPLYILLYHFIPKDGIYYDIVVIQPPVLGYNSDTTTSRRI